jgi:hypothetical protein
MKVTITSLALICAGWAGCTVPNPGYQPDTDGQVLAGDGQRTTADLLRSGTISIFIKGDRTKKQFQDGLSGQTPRSYEIAVARYQLLRSAGDPAPVLCFDHGKQPYVLDVARDNLVGYCQTSSIPNGLYTHGRTKVDWARYSVEGTYHALGQQLPGKFTFFRAFSDVSYNNKPFKAGQGTITFKGITTVELPVTYGPLPAMPGIQHRTKDGQFTFTFRYTRPLQIDQTDTGKHWARFHWQIDDAFRWADAQTPGYKHGVWDVSPLGGHTESVKLFGVSGYYVTASTD